MTEEKGEGWLRLMIREEVEKGMAEIREVVREEIRIAIAEVGNHLCFSYEHTLKKGKR